MRRRLTRKKKTIFLCILPVLLAGGVSLWRGLESQREIWAQEIRLWTGKTLTESLGLETSVGEVRFNALGEVVLEDLTFALPGGGFIRLDRTHLQRERNRYTLIIKDGKAHWKDVAFSSLKGRIKFEGGTLSAKSPLLPNSVQWEGILDSNRGKVQFSLFRRNPLFFQGKLFFRSLPGEERSFSGSGDLYLLIPNKRPPWRSLRAKLVSRGLEWRGFPLERFFGDVSISEGVFSFRRIAFGKHVSASGRTKLASPFETAAHVQFSEMRREEVEPFVEESFLTQLPQRLKGKLFVRGPLRRLRFNGHGVAYDGVIKRKGIDYKQVNGTFQGEWPILTLESRLERVFPKESFLAVSGLVDLSAFGRKGFYKTLAVEEADAVVWEEMTLQKPSEEEVVFGKGNGTTSVTLKTFLNQGFPAEEEAGELEMDYKLLKDKHLKVRLKGEEEFFGLEHQLKF